MPDAAPITSAPSFYKIFVKDLKASSRFYQSCLGFKEGRHISAPEFEEVILSPAYGGASLILCRYKDGRPLHHGNAYGPTGYFVQNVDLLHAAMLAAGASPIIGPLDVSGLRIAIVSDLDGHPIEILQQPRTPDEHQARSGPQLPT